MRVESNSSGTRRWLLRTGFPRLDRATRRGRESEAGPEGFKRPSKSWGYPQPVLVARSLATDAKPTDATLHFACPPPRCTGGPDTLDRL